MDEIDLTHLRVTYRRGELVEEQLPEDPIVLLRDWLAQALDASLPEPNAMAVSTASASQPSARMVLLRRLDERGLVFFTSYESRKGNDIRSNPHVATLFYWPQFERQVRVEGVAEPLPEHESDDYFAGRPRGHQIGAWASEQSEPIEGRALLEQRMRDYEQRFEGEEVARPHSWGGYLIRPHRVEFWQGRPNRLHDRIVYERTGARWERSRLQP